ncbi:FGGY-family carbohydrate kinase [Yersinia enterocolitica]|uniref:FGGY-family carbohydrate kinase n=1 Tax=Yersinia enterocolitica TaxID=630 RepID=UPI0003D95473|nr:FGGY-family carbohydrate kinase [Yersinia enterocolitica]EKN3402878.1 carbohydrate kinase [Yersinia enterocolitica]EKN3634625.1 carbohydrate kinase [Yersinia enterocolitica]EKN3686707.1 carbohydrate kinase [Yersinia enterocolitica]EKN3717458.1 carbohydrate kinase [Yersinia enterocolitica]EKN3993050.1 carbohydrate kinase [Yersinia enterocolitica]
MDYYLGIDVGTSKVKSVLFDTHFNECLVASVDNLTLSPHSGYAEQDMQSLWLGVVSTLKTVMNSPLLRRNKIRSIGITGQGEGVWLVDSQGRPVRNAILWSDTRSSALVEYFKQQPGLEEQLFAISGTPLLPCNSSMILRWLQQYEPETLAQADHFFFAKDWIRYQLTGESWLEISDTGTSLLDLRRGELSNEVLSQLGITNTARLFPPLLPSAAIAGHITTQVAQITGLAVGIPVCAGALDVSATALGIGAVNHGDVYTILGTTCCTGIVCNDLKRINRQTRFVPHALSGHYINLFALQSGTPNIDWALSKLTDSKDFLQTSTQLEAVPAGCGGVFYQPYINGERAPFYSPSARAGFFGISQHTTDSHLLRAVFEGLAYAIKDSLADYPAGGRLYLAGGGAASSLWLQIIADCTGREVVTRQVKELGARGAAMLAAQAIGQTASLVDSLDNITTYTPDPQQMPIYDALYPVFRQLREALQPVWQAREQALSQLNSAKYPPHSQDNL